MAPRSKVLGDGAIGGEKPLAVSWGFEFSHASFSLPGRLVRMSRPILKGIFNLSSRLCNRSLVCDVRLMNTSALPDHYKHRRFPIENISHGVWLYFRVNSYALWPGTHASRE
jgi:hypothetical protein